MTNADRWLAAVSGAAGAMGARRLLPVAVILAVACRAGEQPVASGAAAPLVAPPPAASLEVHRDGPPGIIFDPEIVRGTYPEPELARVLHKLVDRMRACAKSSEVSGSVVVRFALSRDGAVASVLDDGSDYPDADVVRCVVHMVLVLQFRPPDGEVVARYRVNIGHPK